MKRQGAKERQVLVWRHAWRLQLRGIHWHDLLAFLGALAFQISAVPTKGGSHEGTDQSRLSIVELSATNDQPAILGGFHDIVSVEMKWLPSVRGELGFVTPMRNRR